MTRRELILFTSAAAVAAALAACGKKGPPKRPDGTSGMKLDRETLEKKLKKKGSS